MKSKKKTSFQINKNHNSLYLRNQHLNDFPNRSIYYHNNITEVNNKSYYHKLEYKSKNNKNRSNSSKSFSVTNTNLSILNIIYL